MDSNEASRLLQARISQLEQDAAGEKDQELEIGIDHLTKRSSELLADMRRLERENQKNKRRGDNLQKERDTNRTELSKTVGLKEKLEKLCRELQRDNNKMKNENKEHQTTQKRNNVAWDEKYATLLSKLEGYQEEKDTPRKQVVDMEVDELFRVRFKSFIEQYELRELHFHSLMRTKELEVQYHMARYEREKKNAEAESTKARHLQAQVQAFTKTETELRNQLNVYVDKFKQVEDTLNNSNDLFLSFRKEMEDMSKKGKRLEKENEALKRQKEATATNIIRMAEERQEWKKKTEAAEKKTEKLMSIIQQMQQQGRKVPPSMNNTVETCYSDGHGGEGDESDYSDEDGDDEEVSEFDDDTEEEPQSNEQGVPRQTVTMDFLQRLARFLDRPLFPWKRLIMGFSVGQYLFETFLTFRQYRILQQPSPPAVLSKEVSQEVFDKSQAYGRAKAQFSIVDGLYSQLQNIAFIHFDVLPKLWSWSGDLLLRFAPERFTGEISHSIVFVLTFMVVGQILRLPSSIYHTFVLEEKFGFNKQTPQLFVTDMLKSQLLTFILAPPILAGFLAIIQKTGNQFFYYLWAFAAGLQVFMITIYPIAILPLFNKLSPLEDGKLKTGVEALAASLKFPLHELYVIDGSKRSAHSNAYFFGLPWKKHIVIYDTLIEKSESEEVIAVLAHELGHWKLGHTTSLFGISQGHLFYIFTLFSVFINNNSLYSAFGFLKEHPIIIGFILFSDALSPTDLLVKFGMNIITRKFEFQADAFAKQLGYPEELARSLLKLQIQNLSTMDADWMYASYHFSHPHLSERLNALGWKGSEGVTEGVPDKSAEADKEGVAKVTGRDEL
ncbi:myosin-like coiled-coil protein-domain-containing protein [Ilyonectria robusta]|uniref:myosin-like coiled-coil protein-domain-containing protein n=1 Tax=Ilyonectria robusta TaxID=1079257 RepID=UPI001E8E7213|nr:myosin-like coiled-coil protein-domain-containing protein [Ilyonectria robusta]KAH8733879.1 myosin-like coiled-coil protein-domain-containing protein [Ilyonectria robusta]